MSAYLQEWKEIAMSEPDAIRLDSLPDGERIDHYLRACIEAFLFVLVLVMFPFTMDPTGDIKFALCGWASLLLVAGWVISVWRTGRAFRRPQVFLEILILFLILGVVSAFFGAHVRNSLAEMGRFWSLFVLYLVASQVYRTSGQVRRLMLVVCVAVAISSIYALFIQRLGYDPFPWRDRTSDEYVNLPATFGNPNFAAHTLILAVIMAVYLATDLRMIWALGFALLFLVHLYFTHQRAGILALGAAALLVAVGLLMRELMRRRSKPMLRPIGAAITTLAVVAVLGVMGLGLAMGISQLRHGTPYPLDLSLLIRYKSYCSAANMILTRPILGYGPANYKTEYPQFWTPYEQKWFAQELKLNAHVHNDALEIAADKGLPAAGLYLAVLVLGMGYGLLTGFTRKDRRTRLLGFTYAAFFCAFLVDGLFGFNLRVPVSAALLFVMAGSLEGVWEASGAEAKPARNLRIPGWVWRTAVVAIAVACAAQETAVFIAQMLYLRGHSEVERRTYGRAEPYLRKAEWLMPWEGDIARERGLAQLYLNNHPEAIRHFERAIRLNPQFIVTRVLLARAKTSLVVASAAAHPEALDMELQALNDAAQDALTALRLCPGFPSAEDALGRIAQSKAMLLSKAGKPADAEAAWREAEQHFTKAVECGIRNPSELYRQLVQVRTALGNPSGAELAIIRATQANPSDEANWPFFYSFAKSSNRYDRFREALLWRIARLQERPEGSRNLATAYLWLASVEFSGYQRADAAERAYRNAISCGPLNPATWSAYAEFAREANRFDSFKKYLLDMNDQIVASGRQPLPHVAALAQVWREGPSKLLDATALLVGMVQGTIDFPGLMLPDYDMKWALLALGQEANAGSLPPEETGQILLQLGIAADAISEWALAEQVLASAMPHLPPTLQVDCGQHWANALIRLDRNNEAVNLLRDMIKRIPDSVDLRLSLARALAKAGDRGAAETEYRALLDLPGLAEDRREHIQAELDGLLQKPAKSPDGTT